MRKISGMVVHHKKHQVKHGQDRNIARIMITTLSVFPVMTILSVAVVISTSASHGLNPFNHIIHRIEVGVKHEKSRPLSRLSFQSCSRLLPVCPSSLPELSHMLQISL